jgi:hypothetical protein
MGKRQIGLELPKKHHILGRESKADFGNLFHATDNSMEISSIKQNISVDFAFNEAHYSFTGLFEVRIMAKLLEFAEEWGGTIFVGSLSFGLITAYCCALADMPWALHFFGVR